MSNPGNFMVIIRQDVAPENIEMLFPVVRTYRLDSGTVAKVIWCKEVDFSHPSYLIVEAVRKDEEGTTDLYLPHWLVFTVVGSKESPQQVGFVWADKTHEQLPDSAPRKT